MKNEPQHATAKDYISTHRQVTSVAWPGVDGKEVGLLKLNCAELQQAYFEARRRFDKQHIPVDLYSQEELMIEELTQQVYLMLLDPEARDPKYRIFKSADEARTLLDDAVRKHFIDKYNEIYVSKK